MQMGPMIFFAHFVSGRQIKALSPAVHAQPECKPCWQLIPKRRADPFKALHQPDLSSPAKHCMSGTYLLRRDGMRTGNRFARSTCTHRQRRTMAQDFHIASLHPQLRHIFSPALATPVLGTAQGGSRGAETATVRLASLHCIVLLHDLTIARQPFLSSVALGLSSCLHASISNPSIIRVIFTWGIWQ